MSPFGRAPFLVIWETTRACALACVHCRAEAVPRRDPAELTTAEGRALIDRVAAFGQPPPLLVLTGGDPLRRPDLEDLVAHGAARGLGVSLTPSGTAAATVDRLRALRDAGLARLAVSLDGASAAAHDAFRRVSGSHRHTLRLLERARALGLPVQLNTTVCRQTVGELPALAPQVEELGAVLWALFFLIPVGRAEAAQALAAPGIERVLAWAAELAARAPFGIKTTEAPHYHRVLSERGRREPPGAAPAVPPPPAGGDITAGRPALIGRAGRAVTDGNGVVFIDHRGAICPSGFLPLAAGNVRADDLVSVYRDHPLFRALRDPARLGGRCGVCEHRERCGGSRARAWAATGDPLAEDPGCAWQPAAGRVASQPATGVGAPRPGTGALSSQPAAGAAAPAPVIAGGSDAGPALTAGQVTEALREVVDPELGMSIVELGLVYGIEVRAGAVTVIMTLTAPGCPLHDLMPGWVREALMRIPGVERADVLLTFDPPWTPDRIGSRQA
jgi:radical SAM protein